VHSPGPVGGRQLVLLLAASMAKRDATALDAALMFTGGAGADDLDALGQGATVELFGLKTVRLNGGRGVVETRGCERCRVLLNSGERVLVRATNLIVLLPAGWLDQPVSGGALRQLQLCTVATMKPAMRLTIRYAPELERCHLVNALLQALEDLAVPVRGSRCSREPLRRSPLRKWQKIADRCREDNGCTGAERGNAKRILARVAGQLRREDAARAVRGSSESIIEVTVTTQLGISKVTRLEGSRSS
jgi:hypothetical protein